MNAQELAADVRRSVLRIGRGLDPQDDWAPCSFVAGPAGVTTILTPWMDDGEKRAAVFAVAQACVALQATAYAQVMTVWYADGPDPDGLDRRPRDRPDRVEGVSVFVIDGGGGAVAWRAPILRRHDEHPQLGAWKTFGEGETDEGTATIRGDMVDPIRQALAIVRQAAS